MRSKKQPKISLKLRNLRILFRKYFKELGYQEYSYNSVIPQDSSNDLLFINAGIVPVLKEIHSKERGKYFSIQSCLRLSGKHNDLSEIGTSRRHHTYFEMAGHFVWGYDLNDVLDHALLFLNKCQLGKNELLITFHSKHKFGTEEARKKEKEGYIISQDLNNEWSSGEYGYQGYCLEIYLRAFARGNTEDIELWNCVYVDRWIDKNKGIELLERPFLDSGMGISRLASVLDNHFDTYLNSDLALPYIYLDRMPLTQVTKRIIIDHVRSVLYIYHSGVKIGNKETGYILKKIVRKIFNLIFIEYELSKEEFLRNFIQLINTYRIGILFDLNNTFSIKPDFIEDLKRELNKWYESWIKQNSYLRTLTRRLNEEEVARLIAEKGYNRILFQKHNEVIKEGFQWDLCEKIIKNDF